MMQDNNTKETNSNDFGYYDYSDEPVYGDIEMGVSDNDSESVVSNHSTKIRKSRSYPTNNNLAVIKKNISNQLTTFNEMLNTQGSEMFASMPIQTNSPKSAKHSEVMPIRPFVMPLWFPSWENIKSDKIEWLNRFLSIFLNISLMISFEIMFY